MQDKLTASFNRQQIAHIEKLTGQSITNHHELKKALALLITGLPQDNRSGRKKKS